MDCLRIAYLSAFLLLCAASAHAGTVAIVRLPTKTPDLTEALSRLHGELLAVGLEVKMIDRPSDRGLDRADSRAWLEDIATAGGIDAVIDIVDEMPPVAVDVWVIEKSSRRLRVSRVALDSNTPNASETLAIRAVEVLRSTFLENDMASRERRGKPLAKPATTTSSPLAEHDEPASHLGRFGVVAGAAALTSLDGVGPAILPAAGLDWKVRPWFAVQALLAGLGSRSTVAGETGNALIAQQFGILGGCYRFRSNERFHSFIALSAGALHTLVEGRADSPKQGHTLDHWSYVLDGSFGAELGLSDRYYLTLAAHLQWANPYVAIHIMDEVVGTTGHPNLILSLTVGAWL